ncbi:MAG: hypothetical protein FWD17_13955 [Polyangiaceae bacterium]|nr:hypothetical protein [Polyangiaceae bacterium]
MVGACAPAAIALGGCETTVALPGGPDASADAMGDATVGANDASPGATNDAPANTNDAPVTSTDDAPGVMPSTNAGPLCSLPGSIQYFGGMRAVVGQQPAGSPNLGFLTIPEGFCVHYFATVPNARQLRVAPGGELFVASPSTPTTGGGPNSNPAIVVIPDDDNDGLGDTQVQFLAGNALASTQGLLFANGNFYYQSGTQILSMPYTSGTRVAPGPGSPAANVTIYTSSLHWPKAIDITDDGKTIYVGNGGDQDESCDTSRPFHGGILSIDSSNPSGNAGGTPVAKGLRNPIALRCWRGHGTCFALELAKDYTANEGGREKMIPIRDGDDWGFPCCASQGLPYSGVNPTPDCSAITPDTDSFMIGDTPFGVDFTPDTWPAPFADSAIVTRHGAAGTWTGARVTAIAMDPTTGSALPATSVDGSNAGAMTDFATGWDDGTLSHGRPAAVAMAPDGRLFLSNDITGVIVWIAPLSM